MTPRGPLPPDACVVGEKNRPNDPWDGRQLHELAEHECRLCWASEHSQADPGTVYMAISDDPGRAEIEALVAAACDHHASGAEALRSHLLTVMERPGPEPEPEPEPEPLGPEPIEIPVTVSLRSTACVDTDPAIYRLCTLRVRVEVLDADYSDLDD